MTNCPLTGKITITAAYGETGPLWKTYHKGLDMIAENKTIFSPCTGTVRVVAFDASGWGQYVTIHDEANRIHILCHMVKGSVKVQPGMTVDRLTVIGKMGDTGNVTGVHLHYQYEDGNDHALDPATWIGCLNKRYTFDSSSVPVPADVDHVSDWALDSVLWAYRSGIIIGNDKGEFMPRRSVTREELAVILNRLK